MSGRLLIGVLALYLLSRAAFLTAPSDWGLIHHEHCFYLSGAPIEAALEATHGRDLPLWWTEPHRYYTHYFRGLYWMGWATARLTPIFGSDTVRASRVIGVLLGALYLLILAWVLRRAWPATARVAWGLPLLLSIFAPPMLLWVMLTPLGASPESFFFYALFLPFWLPVLSGRLRWRWLALAGVLAAFSFAFAFVHLHFGLMLLVLYLLCDRSKFWEKLVGCTLFAAITAGLGAWLSYLPGIVYKLGLGLHLGDSERSLLDTIGRNLSTLFSRPVLIDGAYTRTGVLRLFTGDGGEVLASAALLGVMLGAALLYGAWYGARLLLPSWREPLGLGQRIVGAHGGLALSFLLAYLVFDTQTARDLYLVVLLPPLFVCLAGMLSALPRPALAHAGAGVVLVLLLGSFAQSVARELEDPGRPAQARCDGLMLIAFFVEGEDGYGGIRWDFEAGERRCVQAYPEQARLCAQRRYELAFFAERSAPERWPRCVEQGERAAMCAHAYGAIMEAGRVCSIWESGQPKPAECGPFTGTPALHAACVNGAHQGARYEVEQCMKAMEDYCWREHGGENYDALAMATCREQTAAFTAGAPPLPDPPALLPEGCERWPAAWQGLCARAFEARQRSALGDADTPRCEAVYRERYAQTLDSADLAAESCLALHRDAYQWCVVGVARARGETDCVWGE